MDSNRVNPGRPGARGRLVRAAAVVLGIAAVTAGLYYSSTGEEPPKEVLFADSLPKESEKKPEEPPKEEERPKSREEADRRTGMNLVGSRVCRECHPGESAAFSRTGHAATLRDGAVGAVARWLNGRTEKDPENAEVTWSYALVNGRLEVERKEGGHAACYPLDFAVGSGANGITFMTMHRPKQTGHGATGVEHRLSYITSRKGMTVTPGQGKGDSASKQNKVSGHGRDLDEREFDRCLNCHATVTSTSGIAHVEPATMMPNVQCERCHGPGKAHVEAARAGRGEEDLKMPLGGSSSTVLQQIEVCGTCHRNINNVSPSQIDERNHEIARFQPLGLYLSRCFKGGDTGLSCTSCHDPHARVSRNEASYEAVCLQCHSVTHRRSCPVSPKTGCIGCHMPKRTVSEVFEFTDHWIRRPREDEQKTTAHK